MESGRGAGVHRIVFDVSVDGFDQWEALLSDVAMLRTAFGEEEAEVQVVTHGRGLTMLLAHSAPRNERMRELAAQGVEFAACQATMRRKNVTQRDLLPFVTPVDSGVAEIVRRQELGWRYIKVGG